MGFSRIKGVQGSGCGDWGISSELNPNPKTTNLKP